MPLQSPLHPDIGRHDSNASRSRGIRTTRCSEEGTGLEMDGTCNVYNDLDCYICGQGFFLGALLELDSEHVEEAQVLLLVCGWLHGLDLDIHNIGTVHGMSQSM